MAENGMKHPVMVRKLNEIYRKWQAGGRRIIWAKLNGYTHIGSYVLTTQEQVDEYKSGRTYLKAATPEMKVYYADKYFDPNNPDAEDKTFYGSQTNMEDIDRRRYAESLGKEVKVEYSNWQNKEAKKRALLK